MEILRLVKADLRRAAYLTRNELSEGKFKRNCLAEYAETFSTACVDAAHYRFPAQRHLEKLCAQVLAGFSFSFKVTQAITIRDYSNLPRHSSFAERTTNISLTRASFIYLNNRLERNASVTIEPMPG